MQVHMHLLSGSIFGAANYTYLHTKSMAATMLFCVLVGGETGLDRLSPHRVGICVSGG